MSEHWNFLDSFVNILDQMTDSVKKFKLLCGLFLISIFVGPSWFFINKPPMKLHKYYKELKHRDVFNIAGCLVGKSGSSHKSATINITANYFIYPILRKIIPQSEDEDGVVIEGRPIHQSIPSKVTESSFMQETIARYDAKTGYNLFLQINPEFSVTIEMSKLKYNLGLFQDYSLALSNERMSKGIRERTEVADHPYFSMLLGAQEDLPIKLEEGVWTQGFPNRILFAVDTYGVIFPSQDDRTFVSKVDLGFPYDDINELQAWLTELQSTTEDKILYMDTKSSKLIKELYFWAMKQIGMAQDHPYYNGYLGRLEAFAIKLACLHRIARIDQNELELGNKFIKDSIEKDVQLDPLFFIVEEEDTQWGIDQAMHYYQEFKTLVQLRFSRTPISRVYTDEAKARLVYDRMDSWTKTHVQPKMPHHEVGKSTDMIKKNLLPLLEFLIETQRIQICGGKELGDHGVKYEIINQWDTDKAPTIDASDL